MAEKLKVPFAIIDIHAPVDELKRRITQRDVEGRDVSEATLPVLERQLEHSDAFTASEIPHVFRADSTRVTNTSERGRIWNALVERLGLKNIVIDK